LKTKPASKTPQEEDVSPPPSLSTTAEPTSNGGNEKEKQLQRDVQMLRSKLAAAESKLVSAIAHLTTTTLDATLMTMSIVGIRKR
jgi:hypothetical protein